MKRLILKYASLKSFLLLLGLVLLFNFVVFPSLYPANDQLELLDTQIAYSPQKAYTILGEYTATERQTYLVAELTADLIYPILYALSLSFALFLVYKNERLAQFPFWIIVFDYVENFGIASILIYFPHRLPALVHIASMATSIKWILVALTVAFIIYGIVRRQKFWIAK